MKKRISAVFCVVTTLLVGLAHADTDDAIVEVAVDALVDGSIDTSVIDATADVALDVEDMADSAEVGDETSADTAASVDSAADDTATEPDTVAPDTAPVPDTAAADTGAPADTLVAMDTAPDATLDSAGPIIDMVSNTPNTRIREANDTTTCVYGGGRGSLTPTLVIVPLIALARRRRR